jgi:NAD-dependent deacetylase
MMEESIEHISEADYVLVIGTSMQVYPAAGLVYYAPPDAHIFYVDPKPQLNSELAMRSRMKIMRMKAGEGVPLLVEDLMRDVQHQI